MRKKLYHKKSKKSGIQDAYWIYFYLSGANGTEFLDLGLPTPNYILHASHGIFLGYAIDGFFATKAGREYLNDVIARFVLAFKDYRPERLPYRPELRRNAHIYERIYKLKDISSALPSLPSKFYCKPATNTQQTNVVDQVFWAIKMYLESLIQELGEGTPVPYSTLESWAFNTFTPGEDVKDRATLKAKCRSVWNWYSKRGWRLGRKAGTKTREEHARELAKRKQEETRKRILEAIEGREKYTIAGLAKELGISRNTIKKHLQEIAEQENKNKQDNKIEASAKGGSGGTPPAHSTPLGVRSAPYSTPVRGWSMENGGIAGEEKEGREAKNATRFLLNFEKKEREGKRDGEKKQHTHKRGKGLSSVPQRQEQTYQE